MPLQPVLIVDRKSLLDRRSAAAFACALVLLSVVGVVSYGSVVRTREDVRWVHHTLEVIDALELSRASFAEVETGERGYVTTGDESFLEPYHTSVDAADTNTRQLRKLIADNPEQRIRVEALALLMTGRVALARDVIERRRSEGFEAARHAVLTGEGQHLQVQIRRLIDEMKGAEQVLLVERDRQARRSGNVTLSVVVGGSALGLGLVGLAFLTAVRNASARTHAEATLREVNVQLESRIQERTTELAEVKRAEQALRDSEVRFRTMANSISQLAWIARADGYIVWYNQRWYEYTGTTPEQMEGWGWQSVHDPERLPTIMEAWKAAIASGQPFEMDVPLRGADGRFRMFLTRAQPIRDSEGAVVQWSGTNTDVDVLKRMEASLLATQTRLNSALAAGCIGTWTWDIGTDRLVADEFTARMFSLDAAAAARGLPADAYLQSVVEGDRAGVADALARAIQSCGDYDIEYRVLQKDGALCWLQARGRVDCDAAGTALNFHGAVMDITERKRIEGRFRRLVDSDAHGVMFWNATGEITGANDAFLRIVGYRRQDLEAGRIDWAAMTPPEYADLDRRNLEDIAATGVCAPIEKEFYRRDGSRVHVLVGAAAFEDNAEEGVGFVLDISERRRTEQALRESEARFRFLHGLGDTTRTLADPAQIMAVTARMLGEHLRASRCAYADVEKDGEHFTILHDYTDGCGSTVGHYQLSLFGVRAVTTLRSGQTLIIRNVETELAAGGGAAMFRAIGIEAIITCPLVKEGILRAMMAVHQSTPREWKPGEIAIVQDVAERCWGTIERRTAEREVHQLNVDLEQRVRERTEELAVAKERAEGAGRLKSEFLANMSHELRTPLNAIIGFAELMHRGKVGPVSAEHKEYLGDILTSSRHLLQLINDVLDLAKVESGKMEFRPESVDLGKLAREVCDILRGLAASGRLRVEIRVEPEVATAFIDPARVKQILYNFLSNAIKFTPEGGRVVIHILPEGVALFRIDVEDTGVGIAPGEVGRLFAEFQQLGASAGKTHQGTGLGLALTKKLAEAHGGRVEVRSRPGEGSTFSAILPRVMTVSASNHVAGPFMDLLAGPVTAKGRTGE